MEQDLYSLLQNHFPNADILDYSPIATGKFNRSYWVTVDEQELVLRIAPPQDAVFLFYERDMMRQEPGLHKLLREKTAVPVPKIILFDDSHTLIDHSYMLLERLPGRPLSDVPTADQNRVLFQVGQHLAAVHQLTAEQHGYLGEHQPMTPQPNWADAFAIMWHKLIDDIVGVGHYDANESAFMRELFDKRYGLFDRPLTASLLHMDVWSQNILVNDRGDVTGLLDWDRALWGDVEIEFAVLDYCGISKRPFWEGYGQARDTSPAAQTRRLFYLLYELQKYIVIRQGRLNDAAAARQYKAQAFELVRQGLG
ncbi:MAG: aminoglycoside phosphotransferase family protein [Chloroflexota bacterium]